MKKSIIIFAIIIASFRANAQEHTKDTVCISRERLELAKNAKGKDVFVLKCEDFDYFSVDGKGTVKTVNTDKASAGRFAEGGTPFIIYNTNRFGERKISKIYVK